MVESPTLVGKDVYVENIWVSKYYEKPASKAYIRTVQSAGHETRSGRHF